MRHKANSTIFEEYLNERVKHDVQAAFLEEPSENGLLCAFDHMSLICDPRAPTTIIKEELQNSPVDVKISGLLLQREELKEEIKKEHTTVVRAKWTELHLKLSQLNRDIHSAENKR
jgi:hypothetical protein